MHSVQVQYAHKLADYHSVDAWFTQSVEPEHLNKVIDQLVDQGYLVKVQWEHDTVASTPS